MTCWQLHIYWRFASGNLIGVVTSGFKMSVRMRLWENQFNSFALTIIYQVTLRSVFHGLWLWDWLSFQVETDTFYSGLSKLNNIQTLSGYGCKLLCYVNDSELILE